MGVAVAAELARRGAEVALVLGPAGIPVPAGVRVVHVRTAEEMLAATVRQAREADAVVMAAAVADFRPKSAADEKLKKAQGPPELVLEPTPDILAALRQLAGRRVIVGFAAETGDPVEEGRRKLRDKGLDLVVANVVGRQGTGFGTDTNEAAILAADGRDEPLRTWTKAELASALADRLAGLLA
jgi:phosphopantothenoylcysteine decarboxylase/phosphopantothenate--cysteine ligase